MGLKKLIARRIILTIPTAIGVVTLIFVALSALSPLMRVAFLVRTPSDLIEVRLERLIHMYGLDQPVPVQWFNWLVKVASLDFGVSMFSGVPTMALVFASLPATLEVILYSAPPIILFGIWSGTKAALNHNKMVDHIVRIIGTIGVTIPVFLVGALLIAITIAQTHFIPIGRLSYGVDITLTKRMEAGNFTAFTGMNTIDALLNGDMPLFLDAISHLALPVIVLVLTQGVTLMRITRSSLIEELGKPYIVSARAKGLSKKDAAYKQARKNTLISIMTVSGLLLGNMLTGLVIVERIFNIHGFGDLAVTAALRLDAPLVFTCVTLVALVYLLINLVIDILYGYIDHRIKLH